MAFGDATRGGEMYVYGGERGCVEGEVVEVMHVNLSCVSEAGMNLRCDSDRGGREECRRSLGGTWREGCRFCMKLFLQSEEEDEYTRMAMKPRTWRVVPPVLVVPKLTCVLARRRHIDMSTWNDYDTAAELACDKRQK